MKQRFQILLLAPKYSLEIQARIPAALCAIHNFICVHDSTDSVDDEDNNDGTALNDDAAEAAPAEPNEPSARRDRIAQDMWEDYLAVRLERGIDSDSDQSDSGSGSDNEQSSVDDDEAH